MLEDPWRVGDEHLALGLALLLEVEEHRAAHAHIDRHARHPQRLLSRFAQGRPDPLRRVSQVPPEADLPVAVGPEAEGAAAFVRTASAAFPPAACRSASCR